MKFRKKPVVIDAEQLTEENGDRLAQWCGGSWHETHKPGYASSLYISTPEGRMQAKQGDWIIRGVNGEFYPCKPDIFAKTYEAVEAGNEEKRS